jgi:hypothetical protein
VQFDLMAAQRERACRGQPADAGADDDNLEPPRHALLRLSRRRSLGAPAWRVDPRGGQGCIPRYASWRDAAAHLAMQA